MNINDYLEHWDRSMLGGVYPEDKTSYLILNRARFKRVFKTFVPDDHFLEVLTKVKSKSHWIIITEPWCGDAAQNVPVLVKLIDRIPGATYEIVLRDESELINSYLTHGGKSIPKVVVRDEKNQDILTWGPRPMEAQLLFLQLQEQNIPKEEAHVQLHQWYNGNKGKAIENEIIQQLDLLF